MAKRTKERSSVIVNNNLVFTEPKRHQESFKKGDPIIIEPRDFLIKEVEYTVFKRLLFCLLDILNKFLSFFSQTFLLSG